MKYRVLSLTSALTPTPTLHDFFVLSGCQQLQLHVKQSSNLYKSKRWAVNDMFPLLREYAMNNNERGLENIAERQGKTNGRMNTSGEAGKQKSDGVILAPTRRRARDQCSCTSP